MHSRLAVIMVVDVVDYSRLMDVDEASTITAIQSLKNIHLEPKARELGGEVLKRMGDGWIIAFSSVPASVQCAIEVQTDLATHPVIKLRIGAHIGEIIEDDTDFYGAGVNLAARLQAEAPPGGLMVSDDFHRQLTGELANSFDDAGTFKLKNIALPINGFQWRPSQSGITSSSDVPTIAVEPFEYAPDDTDTRAAAADLRDQLILRLSKRTGVRVLDEVTGRSSEAVYLLRGRLRLASGRGRLNVTLLLREDARAVLSQSYQGDTSDIFAFCDELVERADVDLRLQLNAFDGDRIAHLPDEQLSVSELRSRAASQFYLVTISGWERFVELMERALRLNPSDPVSHAMRAEGTVLLAAARYEDIDPKKRQSLNDGFNLAVEQAPRSDYVFWARSLFAIHVLRDPIAALKDVERTLSLNSVYPPAHENLGLVNLLESNYKDAVISLEKAVAMSESDPLLSTRLFMLSIGLICASRPGEARNAIERAIQVSPRPRSFHLLRAHCCRLQGDQASTADAEANAMKLPREANALSPRPPLPDEQIELSQIVSPFQ
ncbi:MAG: adenylate/guanylate cyclase domain-containing protein [Hyphomicrobiaceae bacterium]